MPISEGLCPSVGKLGHISMHMWFQIAGGAARMTSWFIIEQKQKVEKVQILSKLLNLHNLKQMNYTRN
jgi:hypothetical protein